MEELQKISIVIPAFNEEENIRRCIESLLSVEIKEIDREIIIVDNGSTDRTLEIAMELGAKVLVLKDKFISAVRNFGVRHSTGELLGFVDADCVVSKDWLTRAIECMQSQSADAVGSFHVVPEKSGWIAKTGEMIQRKKKGVDPNYIPSGNMIIKRYAFEAVGGFNESLETNEDVEICNRLKKYNYKLFLSPEIKAIHLGAPKNGREMFIRELWHGTNSWTVFFMNLKKIPNVRIVFYSVINLLLILCIVEGIIMFLSGRGILALAMSLLVYLLSNLVVTMLSWIRIRKYFMNIFFYMLIYGVARAISVLKWIGLTIFPTKL